MRVDNKFYPILFLMILFSAWEACCIYLDIPDFILPSPSSIAVTSVVSWKVLLTNALVTTAEIILGIFLSVGFSIPAALMMFLSPGVEKTLSPILVASQAIPVFALAPLLVIWFGYGMTSKVIMASVIIFFPITVNLLDGFKSCEREYAHLFRIMGASTADMVKLLYWPWALPQFFTGLKIGVSVATIGAVIGEWVGSQRGLGFLMTQANARLEVDLLFASILWLSAIGLTLWKITGFLEKKIINWK